MAYRESTHLKKPHIMHHPEDSYKLSYYYSFSDRFFKVITAGQARTEGNPVGSYNSAL